MHQGQAIDVVGSLVALATSVVRLELRLDAARARAAQLGPVLVGDSVNVIAGLVERVTRDGDGNLGYVLGNLLLSAAESSVRAERASWVERAAPGLLDAAIASIGTVPDGRVYQEACDIADRLVSDARARGDMDALSVWLTYGGKLRFVPYGVQIGRATEYGSAYQAWQARLRHHLADHEPGVQADTVAMPSPQQSVSAAIPLLREAASLHGGQRRGWQLKLVVQALDLLERVGGQVSSGEIVANAKEALHLLDRRHDPAGFVNLLFILARHGAPEPLDATMLPPVPLDRCLAEFGLVSTGDMLRLSLDVALDAGRPDVVRAVLRDARKILPQLPEQNRLFILVAAMHALPGDRTACPKGPLDPTERERDLDSRAEREGWSPRELAAALAHLGVHAGHVNQPFVGLGLLVRARELDADYHDGNSSSAGYVEAQLAYQAAIQELERGKLASALPQLLEAASVFALAGSKDQTLDSIHRARRALDTEGSPETAAATVIPAAAAVPAIALMLRDDADTALGALCRSLARLLSEECKSMLLVHQMGKAFRLTVAQLAAGSLRNFADEEALLGAVAEAEAASEQAVPSDGAPVLDNELVLGAYLGTEEVEEGITPAERLSNVRRHYNRALLRQLMDERVRQFRNPYLPIGPTAALLPDRTVLISMFLGEDEDQGVIYVTAVTSDRVECTWVARLPRGLLLGTADNGQKYRLHPIAMDVFRVRDRIRDDPLFRPVSRSAEKALRSLLVGLLGPLADRIPEWRAAGRDHLCIWPQGPLHFMPFHLLHTAEGPLADDWTVTTLPGLASLVGSSFPRNEARLLAVGSPDGGGRYGLAREDVVSEHAHRIAGLAGGTALTGAAATRKALLSSLPGVRYAHIGAHGSQNVVAPAFHCIYLAPGVESDGRVYAHDIVHCDLRGVDMITLSACQSALGRVDYADNLQGLPAAFLLAGARSVVGCLWPVHPDAAGLFFTSLYELLATGASRLLAFRNAQSRTRESFPRYRDWGAFCLIGDWR